MRIRVLVFCLLMPYLVFLGEVMPSHATTIQESLAVAKFREAIRGAEGMPPDLCSSSTKYSKGQDFSESDVFQAAENVILKALNEDVPDMDGAGGRATAALKHLEEISATVDAGWPKYDRFFFQIVDLKLLVAAKVNFRGRAWVFAFGVPANSYSGKSNKKWRRIYSEDESEYRGMPQSTSSVDLYRLHPAPSGEVRFLVRDVPSGCAGSLGLVYEAYQWRPSDTGNLDLIIKQLGSLGLDDKVKGFPQIGELRTKGPIVTLPFCWFSAIDTWDNPSLCAVDKYDLSDETVHFVSRTYNRPDLLPIARVIQFAQKHDYRAVRAYCGSSAVARKLVRVIPPFAFAGELDVKSVASGEESIAFGEAYRFTVERVGDRWVVTSFVSN